MTFKHFKKKVFAILIGGMIAVNSLPFAESAIVTDKLPLLTYADHIVYTYDKPNGKKKGSISPSNSLVMIKKIRSDGWAYGSYKIANQNKRVNRWFRMSDLQGYIDFQNYDATAHQDCTATRTRTGTSSFVGRVAQNDNVIVVAQKGNSLKIIFQDEANHYRMGWIPKSVLEETPSYTDSVSDFGNTDIGFSDIPDNNYSYDDVNSDGNLDDINVDVDSEIVDTEINDEVSD